MVINLPEDADKWLNEFQQLINDNPDYAEEASDWGEDFNGAILFVLESDPEAGLEETYRFFFDLSGGKCHEARSIGAGEDVDPGYVVRGPFRKWRAVWEEELDPIQSVLTGELELEGDINRVMQYSQAIQTVLNTALEIDAELPEDQR